MAKIDEKEIQRILVITLSNVGDIVLTTPVISALAEEFPQARIDVMVGPRGKDVFEKDPRITKVVIYDKRVSMVKKRRLSLKLKKLRYDLAVDLRNTIFPILIGARYRTSTIQKFPRTIVHRKHRHLFRLQCLGIDRMDTASSIHIPDQDEKYVDGLLGSARTSGEIVVVNPGAKSRLKRWTKEGFSSVCDRLINECGSTVALVGCDEDRAVVDDIAAMMKREAINLVGKTNVRQLADITRRARLVITNDSAPLHVACAVGTTVLSIFGPTDPKKYGPTGDMDISISKKLFCSPCEKAECRYDFECMRSITADEVFQAAKEMLEGYEIR
ncbi:MAG: glycosyltransferase family 9 protein [Candidatus Omnitrophota bacterium]